LEVKTSKGRIVSGMRKKLQGEAAESFSLNLIK